MGKTICVFGDVMLDAWVKCNPVKVSPEAPVLVCRQENEFYSPGGAANVAANLKSGFGLDVRLIGLQANDSRRKHLIDAITASGISTRYLVGMPNWCNIEKRRFVDALGRHLMRLDTELDSPEIPDYVQHNMNAHLHVASQECDTLLISDYGKGTCTKALTRIAIQKFRDREKYVIVNGKPSQFLNYRNASLLVYNLAEAQEAWYKFGNGSVPYEPSDLAGMLYNQLNANSDGTFYSTELLITCGDRGMVLWSARGSQIAEAVPVQVADVCGAGDVVVATIAAAGRCDLDVMHYAAVNAAEVVSQHGTSICNQREV